MLALAHVPTQTLIRVYNGAQVIRHGRELGRFQGGEEDRPLRRAGAMGARLWQYS